VLFKNLDYGQIQKILCQWLVSCYCPTALYNSHFHIRLHRRVLLDCLLFCLWA
jgi:hypothetical protein